jgi:hypothetical protein
MKPTQHSLLLAPRNSLTAPVPLQPSGDASSTCNMPKGDGIDAKDSTDRAGPSVKRSQTSASEAVNIRPNDAGPGPSTTRGAVHASDAVNMQSPPPNEPFTFNEPEDKATRRGEQHERRQTKCGCTCKANCNCRCPCAHEGHCVCRRSPCDGRCGTRVSRNLVVSIDGTSNQFGFYVSWWFI